MFWTSCPLLPVRIPPTFLTPSSPASFTSFARSTGPASEVTVSLRPAISSPASFWVFFSLPKLASTSSRVSDGASSEAASLAVSAWYASTASTNWSSVQGSLVSGCGSSIPCSSGLRIPKSSASCRTSRSFSSRLR